MTYKNEERVFPGAKSPHRWIMWDDDEEMHAGLMCTKCDEFTEDCCRPPEENDAKLISECPA